MIEYKGYTGVFEFDPDFELFTGHVVDLRDEIYFEGGSIDELKESLKRAVDHYLSVCRERGEEAEKPFSGRLNLRLGSDLHRDVAVAAAASGESINSWIVRVVGDAAEDVRRPLRANKTPTPKKQTASGSSPRKKKQTA